MARRRSRPAPEEPRPPAEPARRYRIEIVPAAVRELSALTGEARKRVGRKIDALAAVPRPAGVEKLAGADNFYRVRAGDHRVIYRIRDEVLTVAVVKVGDRKDVYRQLEELRKRLG